MTEREQMAARMAERIRRAAARLGEAPPRFGPIALRALASELDALVASIKHGEVWLTPTGADPLVLVGRRIRFDPGRVVFRPHEIRTRSVAPSDHDLVLETLRSRRGGLTRAQIAQASGIDTIRVKTILRRLIADGAVRGRKAYKTAREHTYSAV